MHVGVHPRQLRQPPACGVDRALVVVDTGDEGAELGQVERLAPAAAEEVENTAAFCTVQPLPDPIGHPGRCEHVLGSAVSVVERAAVVVGGLHLRS